MTTHDATSEPKKRNEELEKILVRAGWDTGQLADAINKAAADLQPGVTLHRRHTRRWIVPDKARESPSVPVRPIPGLACTVLSLQLGEPITPADLGWPNADPYLARRYARTDEGLCKEWTTRGALDSLAHVVDPGGVERRVFVASSGATLTAVALQWLFKPDRVSAALRGDRVTDALLDDFAQVAGGLRRADDKMGDGKLLPIIRENLRLVVDLLKNNSYTDTVGKRLYALAAELGRLAGWVAYDSGNEALAQRYWMAALRNAHVSGDRGIGANILACMSIAAASSPKPQDAVDLVRSALQFESELTPAVAGMLHARLAKNAATVGDTYTSKQSLDSAATLLRRSTPEEEPDWIYWFNHIGVEYYAGSAGLLLGRFAEAEGHLRSAIALIGSDYPRDRALKLCDLAKARLGAGSLDHACSTASEAAVAIRRLSSKRGQNRLAEFRKAAAPYANTKAVRDFDDKHGDLVIVSQR
jgi:tetratricopeptide (TPR) repeat protein